ncbi:hypothetical protein ACQKMK_02115 [Viridibacillus arvi]|uniref:hypothetical protein n=1 Tax=Viridibacillus arvi TaxID=263475 RepID=UPI003D02C7F2
MGKFNLKFVKPVASLAIGAAVLTGSFAVTGAADTAFAKAATVKVSKGKLVSAKSGKAVKGYKSYKGVLYKNGKKFTGLYKNTYYKSGKKGTGLYKNVYYKAGKKGSGWVGSGSSKKWYQDGKLLTGLGKNSGKLFIKGKYANGIVTYKGEEKLYKDGVVVKTVVDAAKAINNTTVEVTFAEAQKASDISAGRFAIEGLEISNAIVKQGNDKVIVLTTSVQEGGKTYTVSLDGVKSRTFKGLSSVIPADIKVDTTSVQGIVGKEVTLKATIDKKEAGVPVTFNVDGDNNSLNKDIVSEVLTDANGVASYTYTQYNYGVDNVAVYATGNASKRDFARVYWAVSDILTIQDNDTKGTTVVNGDTKQYKVTFKDPKTGNVAANQYVNIAFAENIGVTADKITKAEVTDQLTGITGTPYQLADGTKSSVQVKTDANGVAIFTVKGTNTKVTPIAFDDQYYYNSSVTEKNGKLDATEIKATGNQVTFAGAQVTNKLTLTPATETKYASIKTASSDNGRKYKLTVVDKDGKPYAGGVVNLGFQEDIDKDSTTTTHANFAQLASYEGDYTASAVKDRKGTIKLNAKGEAEFYVFSSTTNDYATPVAWIDQNTNVNNQSGALETGEPSIVGDITFFQAEAIGNSVLTTTSNGVKVTNTLKGTDVAKFQYDAANQSGNIYGSSVNKKVTYTIANTGSEDLKYSVDNGANYVTINVGGSETVEITGTNNYILVKPAVDSTTSVTVTANGYTLDASGNTVKHLGGQTSSVKFAQYATDALVTGTVNVFDVAQGTLEINGKKYKYDLDGAKYFNAAKIEIDQATFEKYLAGAYVSASKDSDGNVSYYVLDKGTAFTTIPALATDVEVKPGATVTLTAAIPSGVKAYIAKTANFTGLTPVTSGSTLTAPTDEGVYYVYLVDAGNRVNKSVEKITVDNTAPTVTGVTDGQVVASGGTVSPTWVDVASATLKKDAGTAAAYTKGTPITGAGTYVLVVTDNAGNVTTITFTIAA